MKQKNMISVVLIMMMVFVCGGKTYVNAQEMNEIIPLSISAQQTVKITLDGNQAKSECRVIGSPSTLKKITINMYLQKKNSSGVWENYKTWYGTKSSYYYNMTKTTTITKGTYRVKVKVVCYTNSESETNYLYTGSKTY